MAYANLTPEEVEFRIQELINREKRVNIREAEVDRQLRELTEREQQAMSTSLGFQAAENEMIKNLETQIHDRDRVLAERLDEEQKLKEKIAHLENAISQNIRDRTEDLHTRSFINSTIKESSKSTNPFETDENSRPPTQEYPQMQAPTGPRIINIENLNNAIPNNNNIPGLSTKHRVTLNPPPIRPQSRVYDNGCNANSSEENNRFVPSNTIIKETIKAIPIFDGRNLFKFLKAIRKVKTQFPGAAERELVSLLKFRISDNASTVIDDIPIFTVNDLVQNLKLIFAVHQSSNYYRGQLSNQTKKPNESMLDFIDRFAETYAAIIDCMCIEMGKENLSDEENNNLERDCMLEFLYALPPNMRLLMNPANYQNLPQIYAEAIRIERRVEIDKMRHFNNQNNYNNRSPNPNHFNNNNKNPRNNQDARTERNNRPNFNANSNEIRRGDGNRDFRRDETRENRPGGNYNNSQEPRNNRFCTYCGKRGHQRDFCFKKQRDESGNGNARNDAGRNPSGNLPEVRQINHLTEGQSSTYLPSHPQDSVTSP
jgi:hypothetical protein